MPEAAERLTGTVRRFNSVRGFGFIQTADEREFFVHASELQRGVLVLVRDEAVEFTPSVDKDGRPRARRIVILKGDKQ